MTDDEMLETGYSTDQASINDMKSEPGGHASEDQDNDNGPVDAEDNWEDDIEELLGNELTESLRSSEMHAQRCVQEWARRMPLMGKVVKRTYRREYLL